MMPPDLNHPLAADVMEGYGVGNLVAQEEGIGFLVGKWPDRVVGRRACNKRDERKR